LCGVTDAVRQHPTGDPDTHVGSGGLDVIAPRLRDVGHAGDIVRVECRDCVGNCVQQALLIAVCVVLRHTKDDLGAPEDGPGT
jgi:hypothetical protein